MTGIWYPKLAASTTSYQTQIVFATYWLRSISSSDSDSLVGLNSLTIDAFLIESFLED